MSRLEGSSEDRIARYKEERRRQLREQFNDAPDKCKIKEASSSSSGAESGPRTTRAFRLRVAAASGSGSSSAAHSNDASSRHSAAKELHKSSMSDATSRIHVKPEKDKSNKRKSNLNRALHVENAGLGNSPDESSSRGSRRRLPRSENSLNQTLGDSFEEKSITDTSRLTATSISPLSSPNATAPNASITNKTRRSELSMHMENARKSVTTSHTESARHSSNRTRPVTSSPKDPQSASLTDARQRVNKENVKSRYKTDEYSSTRDKSKVPNSSHEMEKANARCSSTPKRISRRLEELTALTRATLALASSSNQSAPKTTPSPAATEIGTRSQTSFSGSSSNTTGSGCKAKIIADTNRDAASQQSVPVSILKRKVSQEETKWLVATPPVTFSPNVIEPAETNRKQGILKKRRSLDESQVLRHRSCSPDVAGKIDGQSTGSILKSQRRSSLEEIPRNSVDNLHGILKRKPNKTDEDADNSLNSPQSILKRRSGASSAGSTHNTHQQHVSIATAVILAAADGAEMILDSDSVRPILKKKSFSEEGSCSSITEDLKPILKKKSSTETDDTDEKPKRPILKNRSRDFDKDYCSANESGSECDVKPILKGSCNVKDEVPSSARPRLSFCDDSLNYEDSLNEPKWRNHRRSMGDSLHVNRSQDVDMDYGRRRRNISVSELVMSFESSSTGAIPKKSSSLKRSTDRYRTQPITSTEFEASLNYIRTPHGKEFASGSSAAAGENVHSLIDLSSTSLNNDLSNYMHTMPNTCDDSGATKMSSDSAFQSLGDGLELDDSNLEKSPKKLEPSSLALQMKAIAMEARNLKLSKLKKTGAKSRSGATSESRYSTQPITSAEVDEASKMKTYQESSDPFALSILERVRFFNQIATVAEPKQTLIVPKRRTRLITQPITSEEVESAHNAIQSTALNSPNSFSAIDISDISPSSAKTLDSNVSKELERRSKSDVLDEGISSDDSCCESEIVDTCTMKMSSISPKPSAIKSSHSCSYMNQSNENTSDESSGGREIQSIIGPEDKRKSLRRTQRHRDDKNLSHISPKIGNEADTSFKCPETPLRLQKSLTTSAMQSTISELRAKLQFSGDNDWRKRTPKLNTTTEELSSLKAKNLFNEELSEVSILKKRKDELDASSRQWKSRVEKSDADNFSVAGRMSTDEIQLNIDTRDKIRRTPSAKRFRGKDANNKDSSSQPASPDLRSSSSFRRSNSSPSSNDSSTNDSTNLSMQGKKVSVLIPNDDTFKSFFKSVDCNKTNEHVSVSLEDFDALPVHTLLIQKKDIKVQKRRGASRNPLKALAARNDIQNEYTEVLTGVAEREVKRLNIEKLQKNSHLTVEALAGLASKEDIKSVALKKTTKTTTGLYLPFKQKMLLQVKGRRRVQTRLVEPIASSLNDGDTFILITPTALYNYIGSYSNIIEQSRAADIINHIQQSGDMGCCADKPIIIDSKKDTMTKEIDEFWRQLGADNKVEVAEAGHPDEDEVYESSIIDTNMVYTLENNELAPVEKYWSSLPKIEMLEPSKVYVFDFGSEMYVWSGKNADPEDKKTTLRLARELWDNGYNYTECTLCPIDVANILGAREATKQDKISAIRPDWALFGKITQHRETILFREKFLDWPDYARVIKVKTTNNSNDKPNVTDPIMDQIKPCDALELLNSKYVEPDFEIEGSHLGRGREYFDEETRRLCEVNSLDITVWTIFENTYEKIPPKDIGHFYDGDTYIIRWQFRVSVTGRELSGKPSKHVQLGRDRCVFFSWLGDNASINEKGTTALLTVELDSENAKQIRLTQGVEPPVFVQLFDGKMVIHNGKNDDEKAKERLFILRGEFECETVLVEVPVSMRSLRSRCCFIYVENKKIVVWNGSKSRQSAKDLSKHLAETILQDKHEAFNLSNDATLKIYDEGKEDAEFLNRLGEKPQLYYSLKDKSETYDKTPKLFQFSSITGKFEASEILCPYRSSTITPYPFLQSNLYSASQPALFLFDNEHELWVWQGWWPEKENDSESYEQTGSGPVRWQAERKAAMQTAIDYWKHKHPDDLYIRAYLIWAGLEPLQFSNLFPVWSDRDDIAALNIKCGVNSGEMIPIEKELAVLTRTTYPLSELLQRPLPIGVDPTQLEIYLSPTDFQNLLNITKEEFQQLSLWKQTKLKKEKGLF